MGLLDAIIGRPSPPAFKGSTSVPEGTLTASAVKVQGNAAQKATYRRLIQPWQSQALSFYDLLGECWYPAQFYGRALSRVRLFAGELGSDGEVTESKDTKAQEILGRVQDPGGGRSNMLRTYGQLRFLTGESYLIVTKDGDGEAWEMVSTDELRINPTEGGNYTYTRYLAPQVLPEHFGDIPDDAYQPLEGEAVVYRFWQRHPRYSALADSPTKGVLDLLDLLTRLRAAELSQAKSRAVMSGILFLANEISFADPGVTDENPNEDIFQRDLTKHLIAPLNDPGSASAAAPMIARVPAEFIENQKGMYLMRLREEGAATESDMIEATIRQIALGLDIPPEVLTGLSDTNHWNAWMIQDETWQSHLGPVAQGFCDDLTTAYFRPACAAEEVPNWERMVVGYDAAEIINHPDRGEDADKAFDRGALGFVGYRNAKGFSDKDAPSDEELTTIAVMLGRDPSRLPGHEGETGTDQTDVATEATADDEAATKGAEVKPGPPEQVPGDDSPVVAALASLAVDRCRELAGSRLRSHWRNCPECLERVKDQPQDMVASAFGFEEATLSKAAPPGRLVQGGAQGFARELVKRGYSGEAAHDLADLVEVHAARTLYAAVAPPMAAGFAEAARRAT